MSANQFYLRKDSDYGMWLGNPKWPIPNAQTFSGVTFIKVLRNQCLETELINTKVQTMVCRVAIPGWWGRWRWWEGEDRRGRIGSPWPLPLPALGQLGATVLWPGSRVPIYFMSVFCLYSRIFGQVSHPYVALDMKLSLTAASFSLWNELNYNIPLTGIILWMIHELCSLWVECRNKICVHWPRKIH